jgi:hypothetical protein
MKKNLHRRTVTRFLVELNTPFHTNTLASVEAPTDSVDGWECSLYAFHLQLIGNHGDISMAVASNSKNRLDWHAAAAGVYALLREAALPRPVELALDHHHIGIHFLFVPGEKKTEVATDLYIAIFQALGFTRGMAKQIPDPHIGRFTEIGNDRGAWDDLGSIMLQNRLALFKK